MAFFCVLWLASGLLRTEQSAELGTLVGSAEQVVPTRALVQPPLVRAALRVAPRSAPLLMAKKKKGNSKADKVASKALAALEALEQGAALPDDAGPAEAAAPQMSKAAAKRAARRAEKSAPDMFDVPVVGIAPEAPQGAPAPKAAPAAAVAPPAATPPAAAPKPMTMVEKVQRIAAELGVDPALPVGAAVAAANEALGLEGSGPLAQQVQELMAQLGLEDTPAAVAAAPKQEKAEAKPEPEAVAEEPEPEAVAEEPQEVATEPEPVAAAEEEAEPVAVAAEQDQAKEPEVRLSKKKQGGKKKEPAAPLEGADTSGRRGMSTRIETFADAPPGFAYLKLDNAELRFRRQDVLKGVTWDVQTGQRVGLVGSNGAGKTTQLRVLAGELELDGGEVVRSSPDLRVAILRQEFREDLRDSRTLKEELLAAFPRVQELESAYAEAEKALAAAGDDAEAMQSALDRMAEAQAELETEDAGAVERKVDRMLGVLGFTPEDHALPVSAFSGGWKMRIGLGKVLLQEPQVLLLDEPTNHMDLESVEWLERFLVEQTESLALVIVSHDREFLDRVCTKIVETELGVATSYTGNYRNFLEQKAARSEVQQRDYDRQQKRVKELKAEINKLRPLGESAAQSVKQKEQNLADLQPGGRDHVPKPFENKKKFSFRFPPAPRCSKSVIELEDLEHGYGDASLFSDVDLCVELGDRIAILGPNGAGKSTLLRLIRGAEAPRRGRAEIAAANAVTEHYEQDQANVLPLDKTVMETLEDAAYETEMNYEELRSLLGRFMFKDDKVNDKLSTLSGGEKARVAMCRMLLTPSNLLLLDEPTNHLDIAAKEVLEDAIRQYEGTVVTVSHDRYFVSQTANTILAIEDGKIVVYDCDYRTYMEQNEQTAEKVQARYIPGLTRIKSAPKDDFAQPQETASNTKKKKNFGGKGASGNKLKGVKNAKRELSRGR